MENNKVELKIFPDINSAKKIISFLEENKFEYSIEERNSGYNVGIITDVLDNQVTIWVNKLDYDKIMSYDIIKELFNAPEHYLYTFSDKDIIDAITNPNEYTTEEIKLAIKIASDRGLKIPIKQADLIKESIENNEFEDNKAEYPTKPIEEIKNNSIKRSAISLIIFIGLFYFILKWDFTYILVLAGVVLIHEIGHFLAMKIFKYNDLGIFFIPLIGAYATGKKDIISQKQNVIILFSGPLPGIIIGLILYYFGLINNNEFLLRTSNIFILLNLFNLIPVMPLDGGKIIKSVFFESNEMINKVFLFLSIIILTIYSLFAQSYFLLIIPFLLISELTKQSKIKKIREELKKKTIDFNKTYEELTDKEYWLIRDEIGAQIKYFNQFITQKKYTISDKEQNIIKQVKAIIQKKPIKDLTIFGKIIITFIWLLTFIIPFVVIAFYHIRLGFE